MPFFLLVRTVSTHSIMHSLSLPHQIQPHFYSNPGPRLFSPRPTSYPRPFSGPRPPNNYPPRNTYRTNAFTPWPNTYHPSRPSNFSHSRPPHKPLLSQFTPPLSPLPINPSSVTVIGSNLSSSEKQPCQICGRRNHQARNCYHRFDARYSDPIIPSYQLSSAPYQYFVAQPTSHSSPPDWYINSGATYHITPGLNNLSSFAAYTGTNTYFNYYPSHLTSI
jgi:hypothetical protein